jgi:hypothetical protein
MSHKADASFFRKKHEWSKYKDLILAYYLRPYLQKVKELRKPILPVDMFAGPGRFDDGTEGSPVILLEAAKQLQQSGYAISVLLAERDHVLADRLRANVVSFGTLADVRECDCLDLIDEISERANNSTLLLYVDPFNMARLHLGRLAEVYRRIDTGASVELLFVFMADAFMRFASACVQAEERGAIVLGDSMCVNDQGELSRVLAEALWSEEEVRWATYAISSRNELDAIAGGNYWREFAERRGSDYRDCLFDFVDAYCKRLQEWFSIVVKGPLFGRDNATIPKYWIVFGSRYRPAIDLVNRAFATSRDQQFKEWRSQTLFANVVLPPRLNDADLDRIVLSTSEAKKQLSWRELRWAVTEAHFGEFTDSRIDASIKRLLRSGRLDGASPTKRDNLAIIRCK